MTCFSFAANEALSDDGQIFSCDLTPHGKKRRVYTQREPLLGVITAITPFNHPLNQVAHKVAPSIATNNRMVLKPSEKTPLSALLLADMLYEAGLPPEMLTIVTGDPREIADELMTNADVDLVTFTGGVAIGKHIAAKMGYRRAVLELGGNDPLIVMEDADLDEASTLAVSGLVQELRPALHGGQADARARGGRRPLRRTARREDPAGEHGDPDGPPSTWAPSSTRRRRACFEARVNDAVAQGAQLLYGNEREGALYSPTVLDHVRRRDDAGGARRPSARCRP